MSDRVARRLNRILLMVPYMATEGGASVSDLTRRFSISRSELMGDLNVLWMCGLPDYDPGDLMDFSVEGDRVYVRMADYFSRPLTLTREEALSLYVAGRALLESGVFSARSPLATALGKVLSVLSEEELGEVREVAQRIDVEMDSYSGRWHEIIEQGLEKGRCLVLEYYSFSRDELERREVEPLSLVWSEGHWYLYAWCRLAGDYRLFRLDRTSDVELTDHPVTVEAQTELAAPQVVGEYRTGRKAHTVKLRFEGREGRRLVEAWPLAKVTERKDGSVLLELRTRNLSWLASYLLKFGGRFRVESPKELKGLVRKKAEGLLEAYE